jgi:hypothetical protein
MKRNQSKSVVKIVALEEELQALRQMIEGKKVTSSPASTAKSKKAKKKASKKISKKTAKKTSSDKPIVIDI